MFSCRIAGLRNLLTMCPEAEQTSPRPEKDVCRLVGLGSASGRVDTLAGRQIWFRSVIVTLQEKSFVQT